MEMSIIEHAENDENITNNNINMAPKTLMFLIQTQSHVFVFLFARKGKE